MARWGKCDYRQLKRLQKRMESLESVDLDFFCKECAKELAARLLRKVIKNTPEGDYPSSTGKVGGTLIRGWTGGVKTNASNYAKGLPINKKGNVYEIIVENPVSYGIYVEFGHRYRNHKGWHPGKFMLTKAEIELEGQLEAIIEKKLITFLGEYLYGK
ncbi:HK97 gp10 family phage protein [Romboutsia sp. MSSM.1001216sp_RTP31141st1_G3_RTP31141_220114]|uniref:HK97 gp10 family phage protein n=1 Tax=unclassified Romboutsia TaxID=2626894 RepID=UPI0031B5E957